ncbi:MAG: DUF1553 domain-containing protein [bacterium]|nr:DUF1553 domain-containing protein [bacterium]
MSVFCHTKLSAVVLLCSCIPQHLLAQTSRAEAIEFFEERIRPVLVEQCYECHNSSEDSESDLALDHRGGMLNVLGLSAGGSKAAKSPSRLLQVIRHEIEGMEMPEGGQQLDARIIADFEQWIAMGAPDPRDQPPSTAELESLISWESLSEKRAEWWSFRPIQAATIPHFPSTASSSSTAPSNSLADEERIRVPQSSIDAFIQQRLSSAGLRSADAADRVTLIRRLYFVLIGLPPSPEAVQAFVADPHPEAYEMLVDRLLSSPRFGEKWARHWMDWIRYAESHGSEGDPRIFGAEHYRDYLIRALNADVPYDQLLKEHIAGDLLANPRLDQELGINESLLGTAHWRMVFHGFAPTDALDEKVRFTDDAINAFSKSFLGLTISCARCHDHKFDAISQSDYYALFGILASTRPGRAVIDLPKVQQHQSDQLAALKPQIKRGLIDRWLAELTSEQPSSEEQAKQRLLAFFDWDSSLSQLSERQPPADEEAATGPERDPKSEFDSLWRLLSDRFERYRQQQQAWEAQPVVRQWDMASANDYRKWFRFGNGLPPEPTAAGEFVVATSGQQALTSILPAGVYSHLISSKHAARLESADFLIQPGNQLWLRSMGDGQAMSRYVIQNYPRNGTVFPVAELKGSVWKWKSFDLDYWQGDLAHIELTTAKDAPLLYRDNPRSWFGIRDAVIVDQQHAQPPKQDLQYLEPLMEASSAIPPGNMQALQALLRNVLKQSVLDWQQGKLTDSQALLMHHALQAGWVSNRLADMASVRPWVQAYRELEEQVVSGRRIPTLSEWRGSDSPLFERGDHKRPADPVPRRFLEVIDDTAYEADESGRLQLAADMLRDDNPFTARVIVNRLWHHVFGQGLVATVDNLGRLGEPPSHPELLDFLAFEFRTADHWSLKKMIRRLVTSATWRQSSVPVDKVQEIDPDNRLLSHAHVRRLEAEAIRDSLLKVAGQLDGRMYGSSVDGNQPRRSVYVRVIRNQLDPFLTVFNAPVPYTTTGRRDVTNVPAQSLALLNGPQVRELSGTLGRMSLHRSGNAAAAERSRAESLWWNVFCRPPAAQELQAVTSFIEEATGKYRIMLQRRTDLERETRQLDSKVDALIGAASEAYWKENKAKPAVDEQLVEPLAEWDFDSLVDGKSALALQLHGTARLEGGALVLDGHGWAETQALPISLDAKSLEALVLLDDLQQQGGGVVTVQDLSGGIFDAIVFGEQEPGHWIAGSEFFRRTRSLQGAAETSADKEAVHLLAVYQVSQEGRQAELGTISLYRNGEPYGTAYSVPPQAFTAHNCMLLFGMRHGKTVAGNRMLKGRILEGRLYDRALTPEQAQWVATRATRRLNEQQINRMLTVDQQRELGLLRLKRSEAEQSLQELGRPKVEDAWTDLVHSMFNMKEFIYVR